MDVKIAKESGKRLPLRKIDYNKKEIENFNSVSLSEHTGDTFTLEVCKVSSA